MIKRLIVLLILLISGIQLNASQARIIEREEFTSKELDEETNLYYYGARYYDGQVSRWMSVDPALGEYLPSGNKEEDVKLPGKGVFNPLNLNLYHYANNNPIKYVDPKGETATEATAIGLSWLPLVDSPVIPVADIVYAVIVGGTAFVEYGIPFLTTYGPQIPGLIDSGIRMMSQAGDKAKETVNQIKNNLNNSSSGNPNDPDKWKKCNSAFILQKKCL